MNIYPLLVWGLRLAGVGQIFIAIIYFWMSPVVGWSKDLEKLRPLNRTVAHTYSRYIQVLNASFGLVCLLQPHDLLAGTPLAKDATLLIGCYWLGRFVLGITYYDMSEVTQRPLYRFAQYAFETLFALQATALFGAFVHNMGWLIP